MNDQPLRILFVVGAGRSGTTLLDLLLGQVPGFFSGGEVSYVWTRALQDDQLCGCNVPFRSCTFWQEVFRQAFGGMDQVDLEHVAQLTRRVNHDRYVPFRRLSSTEDRAAYEVYGRLLGRLFHAVRDVSGARWIVDSSKGPFQRVALDAIPGAEIHTIHLVRDSRAVAFSWQRKKVRREIHWKQAEMKVFPAWKSALHWDKRLLQSEAVRVLPGSFQTVRYEDLVTDPAGVLQTVLERLGEPAATLSFLDGGRVTLGVNHTVSGNPMRFQRGTIEVRPDTEWREKMAPAQKALVTALSLPHLLRFRYLP